MKNDKGITLTSLVIYIALIFVVLAILMRITTYFNENIREMADVSFETEFNKLNIYLLDESKKSNNGIQEITEDGAQITFSNGNKYNYNAENKTIYLNNNIKICENIETCLFEQKIADNGKDILSLTIKIDDIEKTVNYVIAEKTQNNVSLPIEYQQVEYIESTGTQYINTRFIPNSNTSIEMKVANLATTTACLYCARGASGFQDNTYTAFLMDGMNLRLDYYNASYDDIFTATNETAYVYKQEKNLIYVNGELVKTLENSTFASQYNMYLMASHQGGSSIRNIATAKLYYCKIWNGDILVREMIPCYRKSDSEAGLYDLVEGTFYTNAGTEDFRIGKEIDKVIASGNGDFVYEEDYIIDKDDFKLSYQQVEYIQSTGTQYINTQYIPSSNTSIEIKASSSSTTNVCLYCARGSGHTNTYTAFLLGGTSLRVDYYNTTYSITTTTRERVYIYKQNKNLVYVDDVLLKTMPEAEFSSGYNMYLMASHNEENGISNKGPIKLYYCKIWDGETIVRDFIPCYRKSDNVVGLYDTVNDVFYTNAGIGVFTTGANVD